VLQSGDKVRVARIFLAQRAFVASIAANAHKALQGNAAVAAAILYDKRVRRSADHYRAMTANRPAGFECERVLTADLIGRATPATH
jgi:hypothetical protein